MYRDEHGRFAKKPSSIAFEAEARGNPAVTLAYLCAAFGGGVMGLVIGYLIR